MNLTSLLKLNMAALAAFGSILLGMGQSHSVMPLIAAVAALLSLVLTDLLGFIRLNRHVANIAALGAVVLALVEFFGSGGPQFDMEAKIMAIANLLIYLQVVLLFQEKADRVYWQLAVLSLLQVVVAAALSLGFEFGFLLTLYMALGLSGLFLFYLHREQRLHAEPHGEGREDEADVLFSFAGNEPAPEPDAEPPVEGGWPVGRALREMAAIGFATAVLAAVFFFLAPRLGEPALARRGLGDQTGFAENVRLDETNRIQLNARPVMRVRARNATTGEPHSLLGGLYLRGMALASYQRGEWQPIQRHPARLVELPPPPAGLDLVEVEVQLANTDGRTLFAPWPCYRGESSSPALRVVPGRTELTVRDDRFPRGPYSYRLLASGVGHGWQQLFRPATEREQGRIEWMRSRRWPGPSLLDARGPLTLPTVHRLAREATREVPPGTGSTYRQALALTNYLRDNGYEYTLDFDAIEKNGSLDPIEDFLANRRKGHCEYFASALALMLRAEGIPSRLVIGYHGGDYNPVGGYLTIRQLDAHAWVEAYLTPAQARNVAPRGMDVSYGAWLRLDPTPASEEDGAWESQATWVDQARQYVDYAQVLWDDYVVGLNPDRQNRRIYQPVLASVEELFDGASWEGRLAAWSRSLGLDVRWLALAAAFPLVGLAIWGAFQWRGIWPFWGSPTTTARKSREFFGDAERMLAHWNLYRGPCETQREYAVRAEALLRERVASAAENTRRAAAADAVSHLADAYYRHRFDDHPWDGSDRQGVDRALAVLREAAASAS